ncbi:hypothetical protein [Sphingomonas sp. Leaf62]|uniref:hypothetical protein n=1 Tax=Sphingomonas sp. Leaf62 TaxID=1736228 RepID=UPI0006F5CD65|nr:hypothetical protein [Sphingomonas sp. Leaf62]KQN76536.1 hypothetical protein ASE91_00725 [Sphingomonas sp. Leaf62]
MIELTDPVQRHIHAVTVRDTIVPDDASDLALPAGVSPKQFQRLWRAMLPGVDFAGPAIAATLDDPVGRRVGRVAFAPPLRAMWIDGGWTGSGPAPHRLPDNAASIATFIRQQTHLAADPGENGGRVQRLLGFSIADHSHITDLLRIGGPGARLFIAASMLSATCSAYEKARQRASNTGRQKGGVDRCAAAVEAALIGTARIATDILLNDTAAPKDIRRFATHLVDQVEAVRRNRPTGRVERSVRMAAAAADAIHLWLVRGVLHDIPLNHDRDPDRLPQRLAVANSEMAAAVETMIEDVHVVDAPALYVLMMARRLDVALERHRWLAAPHPVFRLSYGYVGGHALYAEVERLGAIVASMAGRQRQQDGATLDSAALRPVLSVPAAMQAAIIARSAPGRYFDLGAYHRAVTTGFIRDRQHWMTTTAPDYTHHAYALGSRFCNLASAAGHAPTHDFIRRTELDKPSQLGPRRQPVVLFYGLDLEETVILGLRQILARLIRRGAGTDDWRIAFGRTVHHILARTAPSIAARLEMSSCLKANAATCKGLINRATALAGRFDDRDHDRPAGIGFDYALWFHRNRGAAFWDRLQKGAKLYGAFGSAFIPDAVQPEPLPGRRGRRTTPAGAPPSRWQRIMAEAKTAFDAYRPLYLKSRPTILTARIMARMSEGYSALASDPQFRTIFRN